jgi:hypothetical protein
LTYQDKTAYEEKVANLVSDYYELSKDLGESAKGLGLPQRDINPILAKTVKSEEGSGKNRICNDLLFKQFTIRIERSPDTDDISNKWCDFSSGTISNLLEKGVQDALTTLEKL